MTPFRCQIRDLVVVAEDFLGRDLPKMHLENRMFAGDIADKRSVSGQTIFQYNKNSAQQLYCNDNNDGM